MNIQHVETHEAQKGHKNWSYQIDKPKKANVISEENRASLKSCKELQRSSIFASRQSFCCADMAHD